MNNYYYPKPDNVNSTQLSTYQTFMKLLIDTGLKMNIDLSALNTESFANQTYAPDNSGLEYDNVGMNSYLDSYNINIQNNINTLNNINKTNSLNRSILLRQENIIGLQNEEMNDQLKHLKQIETKIISKDRLVEENQLKTQQYDSNIRILSASIIFAIILFIVYMLYSGGKIDYSKLSKISMLIIIIFIIYLLYQYNVFYLKDSISSLFSRQTLVTAGKKINEKTQQFNDALLNEIYGDKDEWMKANCNQPCEDSGLPSEISGSNFIDTSDQSGYTPGYYYYDKSTPPQLLVPDNTEDKSPTMTLNGENYKYTIDWQDIPTVYDDTMKTMDSDALSPNQYDDSGNPKLKLVGPGQTYTSESVNLNAYDGIS